MSDVEVSGIESMILTAGDDGFVEAGDFGFFVETGGMLDLEETSEFIRHLCARWNAAPDLLAACREFVRKCDAGEAKSVRSYAQMRAAIAKYEGE